MGRTVFLFGKKKKVYRVTCMGSFLHAFVGTNTLILLEVRHDYACTKPEYPGFTWNWVPTIVCVYVRVCLCTCIHTEKHLTGALLMLLSYWRVNMCAN